MVDSGGREGECMCVGVCVYTGAGVFRKSGFMLMAERDRDPERYRNSNNRITRSFCIGLISFSKYAFPLTPFAI